MKKCNAFVLVILPFLAIGPAALSQAPVLIKTVDGNVVNPKDQSQNNWKSNQWNGKHFYQGTGSPAKLCITDGTSAGTVFVSNLGSGTTIDKYFPAQDFMYIVSSSIASFSPILYQYQLWRSNGTAAGTTLLYTFENVSIANSSVFTSDVDGKLNYSVQGNTIFFSAWTAAAGNEIWTSDGTAAGTRMVKDIKAGTGNSSPLAFCRIGGQAYFSAAAVGFERKLWRTDGTEAGTEQVAVAEPFFMAAGPAGKAGNKMIFYANNTVNGIEPWVSDGTPGGTFMLADVNPAGNANLTTAQNSDLRFNAQYCFLVMTNGATTALWRTDGTSVGTLALTTPAQNAKSGVSGGSYTALDDQHIWMIDFNVSGANEKLYRSDGTPAGTTLVHPNLSYAQNLYLHQGELWFASRDQNSTANVEAWRSQGQEVNTSRMTDIAEGLASSNPFGFFTAGDGGLCFFAQVINGTWGLYKIAASQTFTFAPTQPGNAWNNGANWSTGTVPGPNDAVAIPAGLAPVVNGGQAFASTLTLGDGATVSLTNATDTLTVTKKLTNQGNNMFSGSGVLALKPAIGTSLEIIGGFTAAKIAFLGNTMLPQQPVFIKP